MSDATIKRLSFETLSQIFLECLPETGLPSVSTADAPVLLSRICSHWRGVALSTPRLWAGLDLGTRTPSEPSDCEWAKDAIAAAEWKIRAGSRLLSYRLRRTPDEVLNVILPHCSQWRHIEAHLESDGCHKVYAAISQGTPHLRFLEIQTLATARRRHRGDNSPVLIPIPGASQLQNLVLIRPINCKVHFNLMETPLLRKLSFGRSSLSLDDCWSCLRYSPNLEHFSAACNNWSPFTFHSDIIDAKALRHFQITFTGGSEFLFDVDGIGVPPVSRFIQRSGASLVDMTINAPMTSNQLIDCLRHTPALTSLKLHNPLDDAVIWALTLRPGPATSKICPELRRLVFDVVLDHPMMSLNIMKNMILSRWEGIRGEHLLPNGEPENIWERKLRSIVLDCVDFGGDRAIKEKRIVMQCIEEGLEMTETRPSHYRSDSSSDASSSSWSGSSSSDQVSSSDEESQSE